MDFALNKVYDELRNALGAEFALIRNAQNELEKLKRLRMVISNVQQDASNQDLSQQNALSDWLDEMKDAAYDAEDIIDIFNTEIHRRIINRRNNNHRIARFIYRVNDFFSCTTNPLIFRHKIGSSVQKTLCRLADIRREREYHLTLIGSDGGVRNQETTPNLNLDVLGRDDDLKNVIGLLIQPENETVVLAGMGGVGKTTLAKLVFNNSQMNELFADRKIWICVSTENFDLKKIIKDVIDQLQIKQKQKKINGEVCQIPNEPSLEALNLILNGIYRENIGKFLLVLDDVWYGENFHENWRTMEPFIHHCKILVTTRNANITSAMSHPFYIHNVGCLPEEVCRSLFENMAFPNGIVRAELKEIGEKIVTKCKGVPLAVRVLGSLLRDKQDAFWLEVEKDNFFDATIEGGNGISGILKFSYDNLPLKSRFCFVYCSIFPKDSIMQKMVLCQQWTGNGFISSLNEADEIFMDLLSRCFFQDVEYDDLGNITTFKMHDLIHDLAQSIAKRHCGILDNSNEDGFLLDRKNIRYLSIDMGKEPSNIWIQMKDAQKLRTLQFFSRPTMNHQFLVDCFSKLKFLRVLICRRAGNIKEVPSSIDNLKLLRYVDFSDTDIEQLPETVCNLQNLQTLKLNHCFHLKALPKKLWKLSELRHLENEDLDLESMPVEMNKLSLLQTLSTFIVNDDGKNLNELRPLNHLRGSLRLEKLDNTEGVSYENGILKEKKNLKSLVLVSYGGIWDTTGQVLEALEPPPSLKSLKTLQFGGSVFPTWMSDPSRRLVKVSLSCCRNCTRLPSFEHLQNLKDLELYNLPLVEGVDEVNGGSETKVFFPSLENLIIRNMGRFTGWPESTKFPKLKTLKVEYCSKLKHMPHIPTTLCDLKLEDCDNALLLKLFETHDLPSSLSTLKIVEITNLTHITDDYFENLMALRELYIIGCNELVSFSNTAMKHLSSLQHLAISDCPNLESLPDIKHLSSLQHLDISTCDNLGSLPNMEHLSSLQRLQIYGCEKLGSLPDMKHLSSLQHLEIYSCHDLGSLPDMKHLSSLQHLDISTCDNLGSLPNMEHLSSLQRLEISHCQKLESLPNMKHLSSLQRLQIYGCEKLGSLPDMKHLSSLQHLAISDCPNHESLPDMKHLSSLQHLAISDCPNLESLPDMKHLSSLQHLDITFCNNLGSLPNMEHLSSLQRLQIYGCEKLGSLPDMKHLSSLQRLQISFCQKLESLPNMKHLSSLQDLEIDNCHNLGFLPDMKHLSSLQHLKISGCIKLGSLLINMGSLKHFGVYHCSKLNCVSIDPDCLTSLEELEIKNCPNLVSLLPVGLKERMGDALIIEGCPGLVS